MRRQLFRLAFAAAIGVGLLAPSVAEACSRAMKMRENETVQRLMQVKSGKSCSVGFTSLGPMETVKVVKRPSHGKVETNQAMSVKYTANAGYVGTDGFAYARVGRDRLNNPTVRTIEVSVTVTP